eukprot:TRINITY_DN60290_c0_g1_i1.p1 TRINITY_DN60290_c0_g1~~TRINITY_DN60290_c0_g1_i1.p1  ORF type:complete len:199 (-),score=30.64 TRINITY_DN60290_c0_g1_i1:631-1227(-)
MVAAQTAGSDKLSTCGSCVNAGEYKFGQACTDTNYIVNLGNVTMPDDFQPLPTQAQMASSLAAWINIPSSRVSCEGWVGSSSKDMVCTVSDEKSVHSSSYALNQLSKEATSGNLVVAGGRVTSLGFTYSSRDTSSNDDAVYMLVSFGILFVIIAPFLFYKQFLDETYDVVTTREKKRQRMLVEQDRRERASRKGRSGF